MRTSRLNGAENRPRIEDRRSHVRTHGRDDTKRLLGERRREIEKFWVEKEQVLGERIRAEFQVLGLFVKHPATVEGDC